MFSMHRRMKAMWKQAIQVSGRFGRRGLGRFFSRGMIVLFLGGCVLTGCETRDPLTSEERVWLQEHDGKITVINNEGGWPPIIDRDSEGHLYGIVMDYQRLLEKKLDFTFKVDRKGNWAQFMERFRRGEVDVNNNLQMNSVRSEYALFTKPYISIPNAIIVRKEEARVLSLETMDKMRIAVTQGYAIHEHMKKKYAEARLIPQVNDLDCLLAVSTKTADAAVVNLAVTSFLIETKGIANLRVAGYADYTNMLSFATRKDLPILNSILDKGLDLITPAERHAIYKRWISLGHQPFYMTWKFWVITGGTSALIVAIIVMILLWNRSLQKKVQQRTKSLESQANFLKEEISARREAEKQLLRTKNFLDSVINGIADPIFVKDEAHCWIAMNTAFCRMLGYSQEELLGKTDYDLFPKKQADVFWVHDNLAMAKDTPELKEEELTIDSETRIIFTTKSSFTNPVTGKRNIVGAIRDITEVKRAEQELQKMQKLKSLGLLAGGIAHDFNNILMGLYGNISMAKSKLSETHPGYCELEEAESSMDRAIRLTKQLMTFVKGEVPVTENICISELAKDVTCFDLSGSNVDVVLDQAPNLWRAKVNQGQMQQVFSNLAINAMQAMPEGGHVYLGFENVEIFEGNPFNLATGQYVRVVVHDEGVGIDPEYMDRIFDPYFSTKATGSGLGLATTYSIVLKHGGHIRVESTVGEGTSFILYLPATDEPLTSGNMQNGTEGVGMKRGGKILVMDDDASIRKLVRKMLEKEGLRVETAADGEDALNQYLMSMKTGDSFDVVIMDLTIPGGVGGEETIKRLLQIDPQATAIVSSGYGEGAIMANYTSYGFKGCAVKPYTASRLKEILSRLLKE